MLEWESPVRRSISCCPGTSPKRRWRIRLVGGLGGFGGFVVPPILGLFVDVQGVSGYATGFVVYLVLGLLALIIAGSLYRSSEAVTPSQTRPMLMTNSHDSTSLCSLALEESGLAVAVLVGRTTESIE